MMKKLGEGLPAIVLSIILFAIWEITVRLQLVSTILLPAPSSIIESTALNWNVLLIHTWQTFLETCIGLFISVIFGVVIAVLLDMSPLIRKSVYPLLVTSQTIPMIALAPLLLIWFGFDLLPKVIIVVLSCFFPIAVATSDGFAKTDQELLRLFKSMNASYWQTLRFVRFPAALPQFFSGLKIAATYSVTGAIVSEYVGAYQGLGIYMQEMAHSHAIALVFATIFITALITVLLFQMITLLEKIVLPWHKGEKHL